MAKIYREDGDYAIREIDETDLKQLLEWRNSPEIHSKMLTDHVITWEEHLAWFNRIRNRQPVLNFAFTYQGKLAGYTGCSQFDEARKTCNPGNYLGVGLKLPLDAGLYIGELFFEYAFLSLGILEMITEVFTDNKRVVKLNRLAGYDIIGRKEVLKDHAMREVTIMSLTAEEWKKRRRIENE